MRSLIVGNGYLAEVLGAQFRRSGVSIGRMTRDGGSGDDRLAATQQFDQVVVATGPGEEHADGLIDRVDGPRWMICSWGRDHDDPRARHANEATLRRGGTVLRLSTIFGRGDDDTISRLALLARRYRTTLCAGDRDQLVQPLHIDDLATLVGAHLHRPASGLFEIAGPEALPVSELCQSIVEILGVRALDNHVPNRAGRALGARGRPWGQIDWCDDHAPVDIDPARTQFDWRPMPFGVRIEQGVHEAIA